MKSVSRRMRRSRCLPIGFIGAALACGCTTSWMWLDIENDTDRPIRANLSGKECVMNLDLGPGQSAKLEGYELSGEVVAGSNTFKIGGVRNGFATWKITGTGDETQAKVDYRR